MADCRLRFVDQCGHVCHLERPLAAAEAIVEFVRGRCVPVRPSVLFSVPEGIMLVNHSWVHDERL